MAACAGRRELPKSPSERGRPQGKGYLGEFAYKWFPHTMTLPGSSPDLCPKLLQLPRKAGRRVRVQRFAHVSSSCFDKAATEPGLGAQISSRTQPTFDGLL